MLSLKQVKNVCHGNATISSNHCRYLERDDFDPNKYYCLKLISEKRKIIDKRVDEYIAECKRKNKNPFDQNVPLGNHCQGYIKLKNLVQGYDIK